MMLPNQAVYPSQRTPAGVRAPGTKMYPVNHGESLVPGLDVLDVILLIAAWENNEVTLEAFCITPRSAASLTQNHYCHKY